MLQLAEGKKDVISHMSCRAIQDHYTRLCFVFQRTAVSGVLISG
jgi:hypothetical protein